MANEQILIVEDDGVIASSLKDVLTKLGYAVPVAVASGEGAVQQAAERQPDLVLMDIRLAGKLDGVEAATQIRERFNIPVVYLTAYADEETLQRAKATEPFGYILKPFNERELHIAIEIALYRHKAEERIKILSGLIPICASCKKIRDDEGYWNQLELYIQEHSEAEFSHGICPECARKLYPEFYEDDE